jgi:hypothetical protein
LCATIAGQANVAKAIAESLQEAPTNAAAISTPQTDPTQKGAEIVTSRH